MIIVNKKELLSIIKAFAAERAPSGLEKARGELFKKEMEKLIAEKMISVKTDALGNYFVKFKGNSNKGAIAVIAHIDEIGATVRKIKKEGTLEFSLRGGYEGRWLVSRSVKILNKEDKWINGVIAGRSAHAAPESVRGKENLDPLSMEIYIGASKKEEVIHDFKLHIGAPIVFQGDFGLLNPEVNDDILAGYSMDNLVALTCLISLTQKIVENLLTEFGSLKIPHDVYIVATTREEIGTEGALFFLKNNPIEKAIGIDIAIVEEKSGMVTSGVELTEGPVVVWQEGRGTGVMDHDLCKALTEVAEKNKIKYQNGVFEFYGSDAGKAQKWLGISAALIGIPTMFSHNVPEISTLSGIEAAAELVFHYLKSQK